MEEIKAVRAELESASGVVLGVVGAALVSAAASAAAIAASRSLEDGSAGKLCPSPSHSHFYSLWTPLLRRYDGVFIIVLREGYIREGCDLRYVEL